MHNTMNVPGQPLPSWMSVRHPQMPALHCNIASFHYSQCFDCKPHELGILCIPCWASFSGIQSPVSVLLETSAVETKVDILPMHESEFCIHAYLFHSIRDLLIWQFQDYCGEYSIHCVWVGRSCDTLIAMATYPHKAIGRMFWCFGESHQQHWKQN